MDRSLASAIAHRWHPVAAPVSDDNLHRLLTRLGAPEDGRVLDLGCGFGEWLLPLIEAVPGLTGVGVDMSVSALAEARGRAEQRGLAGRVQFVEGDAAGYRGERFDAVLCIGVSHAFGGLAGTLTALRGHLRAGGRILLGDGFWEVPPSDEALAALGAQPGELPGLIGLMAEVTRQRFEPGYGHISTLAEWDDYEWSWTGALTDWAVTEAPTDADVQQALETARTHRSEWLEGYRGQLGFLTVVLHDLLH